MNNTCLDCGKEIYKTSTRCKSCAQRGERNHGFGKCLSEETKKKIGLAGTGKKHSEETKKKISNARLGEKNCNWNGGVSLVERFCLDCGKKIYYTSTRCKSCASRVSKLGELNPNFGEKGSWWKGDEVGYNALHNRIRKTKPKPELCELCGEKKQLDLSNISGKYLIDIADYQYICRLCHKKYDKANPVSDEARKRFGLVLGK